MEKHVEVKENKEIWKFDNGEESEIPPIEKSKSLIEEIHASVNHRGIEAVYYELKKWYWPGVKETIVSVIEYRKTCQIMNRKQIAVRNLLK